MRGGGGGCGGGAVAVRTVAGVPAVRGAERPAAGGFAYGNSPSEFSRLDLAGKSAILATSNGTRILAALAEAPAVLVGCLLNRTAAARAAVAIARERGLDITVVCSAAHGGSTFVLERRARRGGDR